MQRFVFTIFFIILSLGQEYSHAQDNSGPTDSSTPPIAKQDQGPAGKSDDEKQKAVEPSDDISASVAEMEGPEVPALSRSDELSEQANGYAFWQTVFGFFTLILAGLATWFAFGAWRAGRKGVDVARDTLDETVKANERAQRAYIGIELIKSKSKKVPQEIMLAKSIDRPGPEPMTIQITLKNVGQSPANNIRMKFGHAVGTEDTKGDLPKPDKNSPFGSMMPNSTNFLEINFSDEPPDKWIAMQSLIIEGKAILSVYGIIDYEDVFGVERQTSFLGYLSGQPIDGSNFAIGPADSNYMT